MRKMLLRWNIPESSYNISDARDSLCDFTGNKELPIVILTVIQIYFSALDFFI